MVLTLSLQPNYDGTSFSVLSLLTLAIIGPYIFIACSFLCSWYCLFCVLFVIFAFFCPCNDFLYHVGTNYDSPNLVLSLLTLAILGPYIVIVVSFLRIWHVYSGFCLFLFRNLFVSESILTNFVFHQNRIPISDTFGRTF